MSLCVPIQSNRPDILCCVKLPEGQEERTDGFLFRFFKKVYAPFVLKEWVRPLVVSVHLSLSHSLSLTHAQSYLNTLKHR